MCRCGKMGSRLDALSRVFTEILYQAQIHIHGLYFTHIKRIRGENNLIACLRLKIVSPEARKYLYGKWGLEWMLRYEFALKVFSEGLQSTQMGTVCLLLLYNVNIRPARDTSRGQGCVYNVYIL